MSSQSVSFSVPCWWREKLSGHWKCFSFRRTKSMFCSPLILCSFLLHNSCWSLGTSYNFVLFYLRWYSLPWIHTQRFAWRLIFFCCFWHICFHPKIYILSLFTHPQNVLAALFHAMKVNRDWNCHITKMIKKKHYISTIEVAHMTHTLYPHCFELYFEDYTSFYSVRDF